MTVTANPAVREVLNQVVNDPAYRDVAKVPLLSAPQLVLAALALGIFGLSCFGYLAGWLPLAAAIPLNVLAVYISFTPTHDASHRAVSSNPLLNDFLGTLTGQILLPGINMPIFRAIHLDHHRYAGDEVLDPDIRFVELPKRVGLPYLMFADLNWLHWYYTNARKRWPASVQKYVLLLLVAFVGLHVAGLASPYWKEFLLLYVIPQRLGLGIVAWCFAHIQHPEGLSWENEPFQCTVFIPGNWLKRAVMFGQADHAMHHMLPHIPWHKYHRVWDLANGVLREQNIPSRGWFETAHDIKLPDPQEVTIRNAAVTEARDIATGVRTYVFEPLTGDHFPSVTAGSHITLHLPSGLARQYSLLNDPAEQDRYQIAVKCEENGRGGSKEVHAELREGGSARIGNPHNNFVLYENAERFVLIAGGIGITPLLAMARRLHRMGRPFELHVCAQSKEKVPFGEELELLPFASSIQVHVDRQDGASSMDLERVLRWPHAGAMIYVCGPAGFMGWVTQNAARMGWPETQIRTESFNAPIGQDIENHPFTLKLEKTGREIEVPADRSVIDTLHHNGIEVDYACLQGTCGTCVTKVIDGEVDHRDAYLSDARKCENNEMCLCVSRAKGDRLVLDL